MLEEIRKLVTEIRDALLQLGASHSMIAYKKEKIEAAKPEQQKEAYLWLVGFKAGYIDPYRKFRATVPESRWRIYENMPSGKNLTWEEEELRRHKRIIRDEWKKRPAIIKKFNEAKQESNSKGSK